VSVAPPGPWAPGPLMASASSLVKGCGWSRSPSCWDLPVRSPWRGCSRISSMRSVRGRSAPILERLSCSVARRCSPPSFLRSEPPRLRPSSCSSKSDRCLLTQDDSVLRWPESIPQGREARYLALKTRGDFAWLGDGIRRETAAGRVTSSRLLPSSRPVLTNPMAPEDAESDARYL